MKLIDTDGDGELSQVFLRDTLAARHLRDTCKTPPRHLQDTSETP